MPTVVENFLESAEVPIEFEDEREEALVRIAVQGHESHDFLTGTVGRFVIGAALQDQSDIEEQLTRIKPNTPWRRRKIGDLQQKHEAITLAVGWLCESVRLGMEAHRELESPRE